MRLERRTRAIQWILAVLSAGFFTAAQTGIPRMFDLDRSTFAPVRDLAFAASLLPFGSAEELVPDTNDEAKRSWLRLLENGKPLGPAHALHEVIWTSGRGAFSHWGESLLFSSSDNSDPRTNGREYRIVVWVPLGSPHRGLLHVAGLLAMAALAWTLRQWLREGLEPRMGRPGWLWRVLAAALILTALGLAPGVESKPVVGLIGFLIIAVMGGLAVRAFQGRTQPSSPMPVAWAWAAGILALLTPLFLLQYLSTPVSPDSFSYWFPADFLGHRVSPYAPTRTPLLPAIHGLLDLFGASGTVLIMGQVLLRAVAVFFATRAMGRRDLRAGIVTGLLLALDPVSSGLSIAYLSESLHSTMWLITLALLLAFRNGAAPTPLVFGVVLGVTGMIRTVGLPMAFAIFLTACGLARSRSWALRAGVGVLSVVLAAVGFNLLHTGHAWSSQGTYLAFPLFIHKQFDASNGPASSRIHADLARCGLDNLEQRVELLTSNGIILSKFDKCLAPRSIIGDRDRLDSDYSRAYREAWLSHPLRFAWALTKETLRFLAHPVSMATVHDQGFARGTDVDKFCEPKPLEGSFMASYRRFVCPLPYPKKDPAKLMENVSAASRLIYQPYLYRGPEGWTVFTVNSVAAGALGVIWMLWMGWAAPAALRLPALLASLVILLSAGGAAFGQAAMLRYVSPTAPLFLILCAIFVATVLDLVFGHRKSREASGAATEATPGAPNPRLRWIVALVVVVAALVPILVVEGALRLFGGSPTNSVPPTLGRDRNLGWDSVPKVTSFGTEQESVLFVGDSFTQGTSWPEAALRLLRESGGPGLGGRNLGAAGFGTTQEWLKTRAFLKETGIRPRAIVLLVFTWNDLRDNLAAPSIYYNHQTRHRPYWRRGRAEWELFVPFFWPDVLYNARITERLVRLIDERDAVRNLERSLDGVAVSGASMRLGYADPRSWDPFYRVEAQPLPYVTRAWASTERSLVEFQTLAREYNTPLIVLALDNAFTVDQDVLNEWVPKREGFNARLPLARFNDLAMKLKLDFVDLQPRLAERARVLGAKIYNGPKGNLSGHLEPAGNEEIARAASEALLRVLSVKRP